VAEQAFGDLLGTSQRSGVAFDADLSDGSFEDQE